MSIQKASGMICLLWAGLLLGGSMVVAPAKFSVIEVTTLDAVRIGRAQFEWLRMAELGLCLGLLVSVLLQGRKRDPLPMIAAFAFVIQWVVLVPELQAHTDQLLQTGQRAAGEFHLIYVFFDVTKVAMLIWAGAAALLFSPVARAHAPGTGRSHA